MQTENLQLETEQLVAFLHQSGIPDQLVKYFHELPANLKKPVNSILDCGGGNGMYLDMLLNIFPNAQGILVDSAQFMLDQNKSHPRKTLILGNLEELPLYCKDVEGGGGNDKKFDLICFSDVLHHCISSSYKETRNVQKKILGKAAELLAPGGHIIVSERMIDSWLPCDFLTYMIYMLTRSKMLASLTRLAGANTGGVGVAYMSKRKFIKIAQDAGLKIEKQTVTDPGLRRMTIKRIIRCVFMSIKSIKGISFSCEKIL